jgi:DNA-binding HxlR family transcriptional regulator
MKPNCPATELLKALNGKWKSDIFQYAAKGPVRFGNLLKFLPEANKQSLTVALRELEQDGFLLRTVVQVKPLHVEYRLTEKGIQAIEIFKSIELLKK